MEKQNSNRVALGALTELLKAKQEIPLNYDKQIKRISDDETLADNYKQQLIHEQNVKLQSSLLDKNNAMREEIEKIKNNVCDRQSIDPAKTNLTVDYLVTMHKAGALTNDLIMKELNKYRGQEYNLLFINQKLQDQHIDCPQVKSIMFGGYNYSIDNGAEYIPAEEYFNALDNTITSNEGSIYLKLQALNKTSDILGVSSTALDNYNKELIGSEESAENSAESALI